MAEDTKQLEATSAESSLATADTVPTHIVGIGASAGGLEAIEQFFDNMPADSGLAFVIVQHLSPDFKSMMDELLARHTEMPIHRIENAMTIEADSIYLIPPKKNMVMSEGKLLLTDQDPSKGLNLPIDIFLRSLAQDAGERAIGVILSGTGSDGSRGIREIHESGGLVIVQEEDSAKFDGMPRSAMATGVVDLELPPHTMPEALLNYLRHPLVIAGEDAGRPLTEEKGLTEIFALLRAKFGIDFTYYKPSTVGRRIERRITINRAGNLQDYLRQLEDEPAELDSLYADLLIGVTEFFRDKPAFEIMQQQVIPAIIEHASPDNTVRVWVPGCATGEEAYSLAILLREEAAKQKRPLDIKLFATDVHQRSLDRVGAGVYEEVSIANVSPDHLSRYFVLKEGRYHVTPELRQMVICASHNLVKDPPFTKIDLVSCRNLLIYFQPLAQRKALSFFHFALRTGGVLFLGPSESVNDLADEFDTIDTRWKMYRKRRDVRLPDTTRLPLTPAISMSNIASRQPGLTTANDNTMQRIYEMITSRFAPASLLMTEQRELIHVFGNAREYLQVPTGQVTVDLLKMIAGDLRVALTSATHRALKDNASVVYRGIQLETPSGPKDIQLTVEPLNDRRSNSTFLLACFEESERPVSTTPIEAESFDLRGESIERIGQLERDLQHTKEHLQTTIEELETSNEELQSTNEELVAANEELQSTNEELHSVNEELYTVNAEHQRKIVELTQLTNDMDNLLRSTEIGTVFVDTDLHIRKFTPAIATVINLMPQDIGRPIEHISHNIDLGEQPLLELVREVLDSGEPIEREVHNRRGEPLLMRILPYREEADRIAGVVLSFVDIAVIKQLQEQLREADERLNLALQSAGVGTWDWNVGENVVTWDDYIHPLFGLKPGEFDGTYEAFLDCVHRDDAARVEAEVEAAVQRHAGYDTEYRVVWPDGSEHVLHATGKVYRKEGERPARMTGICWDVTGRVQGEETRSRMAAIVESSHDAILAKNLDGMITSWNESAERLYGYTADEVVGRPVTVLSPDDRPHEATELIDKVRRGERVERYRTIRKCKDGTLLHVSITISPIRDSSGNVIGASASARDITARIEAETQLKESLQKVEQANDELKQFAYVASHDLREPLRTVRSFCELLDKKYRTALDDQAEKWIGFMVDATAHMQQLIDDLLAYSRLQTRAQSIEATDCNEVMREVMQLLDSAIQKAGAKVTFDDLPTVQGEESQLTQLLQNLISNAVKYRGEQPCRIHVAAQRDLNDWKFSVCDNGIGIKEEFFDKVFELFKRLHAKDKYSGTGIGLAICRKIVHRHGGRMWLESTFGDGTTFYFTIPIETRRVSEDSSSPASSLSRAQAVPPLTHASGSDANPKRPSKPEA